MNRKRYYILWCMGAGFIAIINLNMGYEALSFFIETKEIKYTMYVSGIVLFGSAALLAHLASFIFGLFAMILSVDAYMKFRR